MSVTQTRVLALTYKYITLEKANTPLQPLLKAEDKESEKDKSTLFPITCLPHEIRSDIYAHYFASLPPLRITAANICSDLHLETQLALSSPYFEFDILASIFYSNCIFSFSSPKVLRQFAEGEGRERVSRVRIEYGKLSRCSHPDWVFLLFQNFANLTEVTFGFDRDGMDAGLFGPWWECVRDAMREASSSRIDQMLKGRSAGVLTRVECGHWSVFERVGAR
jgi:hypothetical protein